MLLTKVTIPGDYLCDQFQRRAYVRGRHHVYFDSKPTPEGFARFYRNLFTPTQIETQGADLLCD